MAQTIPAWFSQTCADLTCRKGSPLNRDDPNYIAYIVFSRSVVLWGSNSVITYSFMGGNANQQAKVDQAFIEWSHYMNLVFTRIDTAGEVRITFDPSAGSWSYVGKQILDVDPTKPTMNLGWVDGSSVGAGPSEMGTILHEIGHTLGLVHESLAPSKGGYTLDTNAATQFYTEMQGISADMVKEEILDVYAAGDMSNFASVDLSSVMRNFMPAEINIQRAEILPNSMLSELDKAYIMINYPRAEASTETPEWTFEHALDVAGVTASHKRSVLDSPTIDIIRQRFALWKITLLTDKELYLSHLHDHSLDAHPKDPPPDNNPVFFCATDEPLTSTVAPSTNAGVARAVSARARHGPSLLWPPGATISYYFQQADDPILFRPRREALQQIFIIYQSFANVTFQEAVNPQGARVFIFFEPIHTRLGPRSRAQIGTLNVSGHLNPPGSTGIAGTNLYLNIPLPGGTTGDTMFMQRNLFHDVGHVLGLLHEHESPNTSTFDAVDPLVGTFTRYDPWSVMLYPKLKIRPGLEDRSIPSDKLNPDPGLTRYNVTPSPTDRAFLRVMYPPHIDRNNQDSIRDNLPGVRLALQHLWIPMPDQEIIDRLSRLTTTDRDGTDWRTVIEVRLLSAPTNPPQPVVVPPAYPPATHSLGDIGDEPARAVSVGPRPGSRRSRLWQPGSQINWRYQQSNKNSGLFTVQRRHFEAAIANYEQFINVKFVRRKKIDLHIPADMLVFIEPHKLPNNNSWSMYGTDFILNGPSAQQLPGGNGDTTLYLNIYENDADPLHAKFNSYICSHELGHTLGLVHEHEGPTSRTETIGTTLDPDSIGGFHTGFDEESVMIYQGIPLRVTLPRLISGRRTAPLNPRPSRIDLAFLTLMYPPAPQPNGRVPQLMVDAFRTLDLTGLFRPLPSNLLTQLVNAHAHVWANIDTWREWVGGLLAARYSVL